MDAPALAAFLRRVYSGDASPRELGDVDVAPGVMCRVTLVGGGAVPSRLSEARGRRTVFVAGRDTICSVLPCHQPYSILRLLGLTHEYISLKVNVDGSDAWLLLFNADVLGADGSDAAGPVVRTPPLHGDSEHHSPGDASAARCAAVRHEQPVRHAAALPKCAPATWAGVVELCRSFYPAAADDIDRHLDELRTRTVAEFEELHAVDFLAVKRDPDRFVSYARFKDLPVPRSAWQTRLFLYCELRLMELYRGDGFTQEERVDPGRPAPGEGEPGRAAVGLREYMCENIALEAQLSAGTAAVLKLHAVVPLTVT